MLVILFEYFSPTLLTWFLLQNLLLLFVEFLYIIKLSSNDEVLACASEDGNVIST